MKHFLPLLAVCCAVAPTFVGTAQAMIVEYPLPELVRASDAIVRGTVVNTECRWAGGIIVTDVTLIAGELFKGALDTTVLAVQVAGGVVDTVGCWVEDQPHFRVGEEVIVFLGGEDRAGLRQVINCRNGKYTVTDERISENGVPVRRFAESVQQAVREAEGGNGR